MNNDDITEKWQLAIMKNVEFGCYDSDHVPVLSFNAYISESVVALQIVGAEDACKIIADSNVRDVHGLEGKPCWVAVEDRLIIFMRLAKI